MCLIQNVVMKCSKNKLKNSNAGVTRAVWRFTTEQGKAKQAEQSGKTREHQQLLFLSTVAHEWRLLLAAVQAWRTQH
jgi:hypothetical protein